MKSLALSLTAAAIFALVACGGSTPPAAPAETRASASARPTCDLIDHACDPHEDEGGLAKECHDLGEAAKTAEATCVERKEACLAVCKPK